MKFLGLRYPCLCLYVMKAKGQTELYNKYMNNCKKLEDNDEKFSIYIHGFWLPHLEQLKEQGLLKEGRHHICLELILTYSRYNEANLVWRTGL